MVPRSTGCDKEKDERFGARQLRLAQGLGQGQRGTLKQQIGKARNVSDGIGDRLGRKGGWQAGDEDSLCPLSRFFRARAQGKDWGAEGQGL